MFFFDWTYVLLIPAIILSLYAQFKVTSTFKRYSNTGSRTGLTGAEAARVLLERAGVRSVKVESVRGNLTDHYDPSSKTLRLSESVYGSRSLSAIGVAAHETGHALQDEHGYAPLGLRSAIVPVVGLGSNLAWPVVILGFILTQFGGEIGMLLINIGIVLFALIVVFALVTLPVEFNASSRAVEMLQAERILSDDEIKPVKKVLNAAAMTYVASAAMAILQLIRIIILANDRK